MTSYVLVNGGPSMLDYVWQGVLTQQLQVGQKYDLSVDLASIYPDSQADVQFTVGGQTFSFQLGDGQGYDSVTNEGEWHTFTAEFTATQTGILAVDLNTVGSGNDFAMDNISVQAVPEPFTMVLGAAGVALAARRRLARKTV